MTRFILIEPCNFIDFPVGGQLSFAKQLMLVFRNELALVGYAHENEPVGKWYKKIIDEIEYDYFGIRRIVEVGSKPIFPLRLQNLIFFLRHIKEISKFNCAYWFIQAPEILMVAEKFKSTGIAYMFPGVTNPLEMPRYPWGKIFASQFYTAFLKSLRKSDLLLACADNKAISDLKNRAGKHLSDLTISHFPTRFDSNTFYPVPTQCARDALSLPQEKIILVCCGRINKVKGWQLIFDSFRKFHANNKNSLLLFVGDGEDKQDLISQISHYQLQDNIEITGFQTAKNVALYLNSCDISLIGSLQEGWSVSMLEALSCGKPLVSTSVSGADTLIEQGKNGYIVAQRDPKEFSKKVKLSLALKNSYDTSIAIANKYLLSNLKNDLIKQWSNLEK